MISVADKSWPNLSAALAMAASSPTDLQAYCTKLEDWLYACYCLAALSPGLKRPEAIEQAVESVRELLREHREAVAIANSLAEDNAAERFMDAYKDDPRDGWSSEAIRRGLLAFSNPSPTV